MSLVFTFNARIWEIVLVSLGVAMEAQRQHFLIDEFCAKTFVEPGLAKEANKLGSNLGLAKEANKLGSTIYKLGRLMDCAIYKLGSTIYKLGAQSINF